jgi:hypothetical protein
MKIGVGSVGQRLGTIRTQFGLSGAFGLFCSFGLLLAEFHVPHMAFMSLLGMFFASAHLYVAFSGDQLLASNPSAVIRVLRGTSVFLLALFMFGLTMVSDATVVTLGATWGLLVTWHLIHVVRRLEGGADASERLSIFVRFGEIRRIAESIRSWVVAAASSARTRRARERAHELAREGLQFARKAVSSGRANSDSVPYDGIKRT